MIDAPEEGERITELLLDGQQRLTALWRSLHDTFPDRTFLVEFEDDPHNPEQQLPSVLAQSRWDRKGKRYPVWADDPKELWRRGYIPVRLLRPGDINDEIDTWIEAVADGDHKAFRQIGRTIDGYREKVREFNLPFLSLPVGTPKDVALDVFIKMNTSSVALTTFDIMVAQVESAAEESLHDLVTKLQQTAPFAGEYKKLEDLVLDVAALMQDRTPNQAGYAGLDLKRVVSEWDTLTGYVGQMVEILEGESIYDGKRLPSDIVLAVVAALCGELPTQPDALGNAKTLLRKYMWRAFFTGRYDRAAATAAIVDFRALRAVLRGEKGEEGVPVLNGSAYPLPTEEQLIAAAWPRNRNTFARAILAVTLKAGARDIADGAAVSRAHVLQREYHHLFPASLLRSAGLREDEVFRALNCALVTWRTNRTISSKEPLVYLQERAQASTLGDRELAERLQSHAIDSASLHVGGYADLDEGERSVRIRADYEAFLRSRAAIVGALLRQVCDGRELDMQAAFAQLPSSPESEPDETA